MSSSSTAHVLLVSPTSATGGAERALAGLARALPRYGLVPRAVVAGKGPLVDWLHDAGCQTTVVPSFGVGQAFSTASALVRLRRQARKASTIIANHAKGAIASGLAASGTHVPVIWWQHGWAERSGLDRWARRLNAGPVVCSTTDLAQAQRDCGSRDVRVIPLGVDLDRIRRWRGTGGPIRARQGWDRTVTFGIVGRLQAWKGQDTFLRAARVVETARPHASFAVVGGDVTGTEAIYASELRRLQRHLGLASLVLAGHQDPVYPWIDALDVVVHVSRNEPFGLVVLEAMALGKAVIAAHEGGPTKFIEHGRSGLLVDPNDHRALAKEMIRLLDCRRLREAIGRQAYARSSGYDEGSTADGFADLVRNLVPMAGADGREPQGRRAPR